MNAVDEGSNGAFAQDPLDYYTSASGAISKGDFLAFLAESHFFKLGWFDYELSLIEADQEYFGELESGGETLKSEFEGGVGEDDVTMTIGAGQMAFLLAARDAGLLENLPADGKKAIEKVISEYERTGEAVEIEVSSEAATQISNWLNEVSLELIPADKRSTVLTDQSSRVMDKIDAEYQSYDSKVAANKSLWQGIL